MGGLQADMRNVIIRYLRTRAMSLSSHEAKRTGNAYQAVRLGDKVLPGFRAKNRNVFAGIELAGKTVIDLGCNLGEICRDAARAGAQEVHGIEYDRYFVQMARYVTAYDGLDVFYRQGDLTRAETYGGNYNVVSALSVHTYIRKFIDKIADMTKDIFVIETHSIGADWKARYLDGLKEHFRHVAIVGISDHRARDKAESRLLMFASQRRLDPVLAGRARALAGVPQDFSVDFGRSKLSHLDQFLRDVGVGQGATLRDFVSAVDRTWPALTMDDVVDDVGKKGLIFSSLYWASLVKGLQEYAAAGKFAPENFYHQAFRELIARDVPGAADFKGRSADDLLERLRRRPAAMLPFLDDDKANFGNPSIIYNIMDPALVPADHAYQVYLDPIGKVVQPLALDGHHRGFIAYILGKKADCIPMWYEDLPSVQASVQRRPEVQGKIWSHVYALCEDMAAVPKPSVL